MPFAATSDGTRLFYKDLGDGPAVLLLHAWAMHSGMWEYLLPPLLDAGHRVVALDRRGHGRSDYAARGFDVDTLVDDVVTVLDHAGVDEHAVMAHSTGGIEAVHLAARGRGVHALVLLAPLGPDMDGEVGRAPLDETLADLRADRPAWSRSRADAYFGRPDVAASDALIDEALGVLQQTPLEVATNLLTTAWTADVTALAASLSVPTLILHGDADASAPLPVTGRRYADLIPSAALSVYPGAGHGFYATHAGDLAREVVPFLAAHPARTPTRGTTVTDDPQTLVARYLDLFNTTDDTDRRELAVRLFAAGARDTDPLVDVTGPDEVAAFIGAVQQQFPGHRFGLGSAVDAHHDQLRLTWHATAPGGEEPTAVGFDVIVHRGGRIQQVLGFLDRVPS